MPDEWAWFAVVAFIFPTNESAESVWLGHATSCRWGCPQFGGRSQCRQAKSQRERTRIRSTPDLRVHRLRGHLHDERPHQLGGSGLQRVASQQKGRSQRTMAAAAIARTTAETPTVRTRRARSLARRPAPFMRSRQPLRMPLACLQRLSTRPLTNMRLTFRHQGMDSQIPRQVR